MALHSVWGASAPPGTYSWYTDGTPSIRTAMGFYRTATGTAVAKVAGARLYVTAGCLAANSSATVRLYTTGTDMTLATAQTVLAGTPLQTVTLPITATGWNEVLFATPVTAAVSNKYYIQVSYDGVVSGYQHTPLAGSGSATDGTNVIMATGGWGFCLATGSEGRAMYQIGSGTPGPATSAALYGIDIIFDDSTDTDTTAPSVPTGLATTTVAHNTTGLSWTASTDDTAVTGYEVFLGGVSQGTSSTTTFTLTGLTPSTAYTATVRARDGAGNWSAQSSSVGFTTTAAPATIGRWINHVTIVAPQNATTSHTVSPSSGTVLNGTLFTPTAGNRLVCVVSGAVTSSTPSGWTKPVNGEAVSNSGLYVFHKTAAGGDSLTTTHNASNYRAVFDFYEFYAGSAFVGTGAASGAVASGGAGPTLSGLTGTNLVMFAVGRTISAASGSGTMSWNNGTEIVDVVALNVGSTDGVQYSLNILDDFNGASTNSAATWAGGLNGSASAERLAFAMTVTQPPSGTTGTVAGTLPKITSSIAGVMVTAGTASGPIPKITGSISGSNVPVTGTISASLPKITGSVSGSVAVTGSVTAAALPKVAGSVPGALVTTGTTSGQLPKITGSIADVPRLTIAQENALTTGVLDKAYWFNYPSDAIPGFSRSSYYKPGQTARFSISYSSAYTVQIYRMGWYGAAGGTANARKVAEFAGTTTSQPAATTIPNSNGAVTCAAWSENVTWAIPADATPGWYWAFCRENAGTAFGGILFCVSDQDYKKPILVVASEATWGAAYNGYGGNNVYGASTGIGSITGRAYCSTYDKPVISRDNVPQTHFFNGELATLRFLERFGFEVGYTTCEQINNDPTIMDGRSLVIFSGHNEYISTRIWDKTIAILAGGTYVLNLSGNDFFWRTAYGDESGFPTGTTNTSTGRVMWCRKDTMTGPTGSGHTAGTPFSTQADWTGTWQDTRYTNRRPPSELLGDRFIANGIRADEVKVPFAMKNLPIWRNCTAITGLTTGQTFSFGVGTAGMEWDMPDGTLPSVSLSASVVDLTGNSADVNGENYNLNGTYTHAFQIVRNGPSYVINGNTTQWGWAIDDLHLRGSAIATDTARQATLNMLYDLGGVGVSSLITGAGLVAPTAVGNLDTAYGLPTAVTGSINAALPPVTGAVTGAQGTTGSLAGTLPKVTSAVSGVSITPGTVAAAIAPITGSISGVLLTLGTTAGALPVITGSMAGDVLTPGALAAVLPTVTGSLAGDVLNPGALNATLPSITGMTSGASLTPGTLTAALPPVTGLINGADITSGTLQGALPKITGTLSGILLTGGALGATLPKITADIFGGSAEPGFNAPVPAVTGSISGTLTITGTLAGVLPRIIGATPDVPSGDTVPWVIVLSRGRRRDGPTWPIRVTRSRRRR